jgi:hypothetical protein
VWVWLTRIDPRAGSEPSSRQVDELLDERLAHRGRAAGSAQKLLQVLATCRTTPTYC